MVSDSPYDINELVLSPLMGMTAGLFAAFVMLSVLVVLQPYSGLSVEFVLQQFGTLVLPKRAEQINTTTLMGIGLGVHILLRILLSLFYSVSQQSIPAKGLIIVGLFYGFIIWMTGSVIFGTALGEEWRTTARSWTWLFANLTFGFCLAATAIIAEKFRPAAITLPKD
jgi:hypothetical protein